MSVWWEADNRARLAGRFGDVGGFCSTGGTRGFRTSTATNWRRFCRRGTSGTLVRLGRDAVAVAERVIARVTGRVDIGWGAIGKVVANTEGENGQ